VLSAIGNRLHARSASLLVSLESSLDRILQGWLLVAGLASAARIATTPTWAASHGVLPIVTPYLLLIIAPFASFVLALRWFRNGDTQPQPVTRLAIVGRWAVLGPMIRDTVASAMERPARAEEETTGVKDARKQARGNGGSPQ